MECLPIFLSSVSQDPCSYHGLDRNVPNPITVMEVSSLKRCCTVRLNRVKGVSQRLVVLGFRI
jgi:hypothetical protein